MEQAKAMLAGAAAGRRPRLAVDGARRTVHRMSPLAGESLASRLTTIMDGLVHKSREITNETILLMKRNLPKVLAGQRVTKMPMIVEAGVSQLEVKNLMDGPKLREAPLRIKLKISIRTEKVLIRETPHGEESHLAHQESKAKVGRSQTPEKRPQDGPANPTRPPRTDSQNRTPTAAKANLGHQGGARSLRAPRTRPAAGAGRRRPATAATGTGASAKRLIEGLATATAVRIWFIEAALDGGRRRRVLKLMEVDGRRVQTTRGKNRTMMMPGVSLPEEKILREEMKTMPGEARTTRTKTTLMDGDLLEKVEVGSVEIEEDSEAIEEVSEVTETAKEEVEVASVETFLEIEEALEVTEEVIEVVSEGTEEVSEATEEDLDEITLTIGMKETLISRISGETSAVLKMKVKAGAPVMTKLLKPLLQTDGGKRAKMKQIKKLQVGESQLPPISLKPPVAGIQTQKMTTGLKQTLLAAGVDLKQMRRNLHQKKEVGELNRLKLLTQRMLLLQTLESEEST
jgi:hypothetical protein